MPIAADILGTVVTSFGFLGVLCVVVCVFALTSEGVGTGRCGGRYL